MDSESDNEANANDQVNDAVEAEVQNEAQDEEDIDDEESEDEAYRQITGPVFDAIRGLSNLNGSTLDEICDYLVSKNVMDAETAKAQVTELIREAVGEGLIGKTMGDDRYVVLELVSGYNMRYALRMNSEQLENRFNRNFDKEKFDDRQMYKDLLDCCIKGTIGRLEGTNFFAVLDKEVDHNISPNMEA